MLFLLLRGEGAFYLTCNVYCLNNIERGLKERYSYVISFMLKKYQFQIDHFPDQEKYYIMPFVWDNKTSLTADVNSRNNGSNE